MTEPGYLLERWRVWFTALITLICLAGCSADNAEQRDASGLRAEIQRLERFTNAGEYEKAIGNGIPDAVLIAMMEQSGARNQDLTEFRRQYHDALENAFRIMRTQVFSLEVDNHIDDLTIQTTPNGLSYALYRSSAKASTEERVAKTEATVLAVKQSGRWYLITCVDTNAIRAVKTAYPELAHIEIALPRTEILSE